MYRDFSSGVRVAEGWLELEVLLSFTTMLTTVGRFLVDRFVELRCVFLFGVADDVSDEPLLPVNAIFCLLLNKGALLLLVLCTANELIDATVPSQEKDSSDESGAVEAAEASQSLLNSTSGFLGLIVGRRLLRRFFFAPSALLVLFLVLSFKEALFPDC